MTDLVKNQTQIDVRAACRKLVVDYDLHCEAIDDPDPESLEEMIFKLFAPVVGALARFANNPALVHYDSSLCWGCGKFYWTDGSKRQMISDAEHVPGCIMVEARAALARIVSPND